MQQQEEELRHLRIATAPFAKNGQLDAFLEIWGRNILRMEMAPFDGTPLHVDLRLRVLPNFALASGSASPMRNRHTAALADNDDLVLVVVQNGVGEANQYGRAAIIKNGDAVLTANGAPATFEGRSPTRLINFRLNRELLKGHVANIDESVARPIAKDSPVLRLMVGYASVLDDQRELATAGLRRAIGAHMHELAALLFGRKPAPPLAEGFRAARLRAVKDDVLQKIAQRSLSVSEIARSQQISERYLRKLFAAEHTTFTDFVRETRLAHAHQMLTDARHYHRPISAIAYESGFGDLSYFNRAFRQRYNMTPSEARELAKRGTRS